MWRNYFKTTFRNFVRNKVYALINILGLTIGITCFSIILLYVENEFSFDKFHTQESYRFLVNQQTGDGEERTTGIVQVKTIEAIADNIAGIEDAILARDYGMGPLLVEYKDIKFKTRRFFHAQADFFDYFNFTLLQGDPKTALADPSGVVLTKSTAEKIFGEVNPMGEFIKYSGNVNFTLQVTGVVDDPKNSHIDFDFLLNFDLKDDSGYNIMREGFANSVYGYFKFEEGVEPEDVADRVKEYYLEFYKDRPEIVQELSKEDYHFQSVYDAYFNSGHVIFDDGFRKGNSENLLILSVIGLFILLVACMNYINAATAKSINRSKEIGVRKVFGAFKAQLITQFMAEAFLITLIAVTLSVLLTDISVPFFESLMETRLRYGLLQNPFYLPGLAGILLAVTLLSGTYPALVLSSFRPSESLKNQSGKGMLKGNGLRTLLVGVQLFLTMILISSILLIVKQTSFINAMDLGFSKDDILIIPNNSRKIERQLSAYKNDILKSPYIHSASAGMDVLGFGTTNNSGRVVVEGQNLEDAPVSTYFTVGMDFIDIQGFELVEGRSFNKELKTDSLGVVVNEAFVRANGLENPIGARVKAWNSEKQYRHIIGVVEDFNFRSLHSEVSPAIFIYNPWAKWFWTVKIDPEHKKEAVEHARASWEEIEPNYPFGYMFLEDNLRDFYGEEKRLQSAIQVFAILCIFISCLGLYGMTVFTIERRMKEIGIRKVLGAQINHLVWLINQKFIRILLISAVVAIPLVYYAIKLWLEGFAYHIEIGFTSFLFASLLVFTIVALTVSSQAIKAGLTNPAKTLRTE